MMILPWVDASGRFKHEGSFLDTVHRIQIAGVHACTVQHVGMAFPSNQVIDLSQYLALCRSWEPANTMDDYVGGSKAINAFMEILVSGHVREDMPPHPRSTENAAPHRPGSAPTFQECRNECLLLFAARRGN
jgi:hypothetical protein